jgi:hypothetical protein
VRKDSFHFGSKHTEAFNILKTKMTTTLVLALPNFALPFTLETDASCSGIGVVLMQQGQPITFYSQALGPKATTQATNHKETLAILLALKRWRHYLLGAS